jgi:hypothetical protein
MLNPTITAVGQAAAINAANLSAQIQIEEIGFGTGNGSGNGYDPTGAETALQNEVARVKITSGQEVSPMQLRMQAIWNDDAASSKINEIGFFLDDGTLFAVWSDNAYTNAAPFAYKSLDVDFVQVTDILLTAVPIGSVTILEDNGQSAVLAALGDHLNDPDAHPQYMDKSKIIGCGNSALSPDANNIELTLPVGYEFTSWEQSRRLSFRCVADNTGPVTIKIAGLPASMDREIKKEGYASLAAGDLQAGFFYEVLFFNSFLNLIGSIVPQATQAVAGKIEIATSGETSAGTDNTRAITPLRLAEQLDPIRTDIDNLQSTLTIQYTKDTYADLTGPFLTSMGIGESVFVIDATGDPDIPDTPVTWAIYRKFSAGNVIGVNVFRIAEQSNGVTIKNATETEAGIAKLADKTAMDNLVNNTKIVTPFWLKYRLNKDAPKKDFHITWDNPTASQLFDIQVALTDTSPAKNLNAYVLKQNPNGMVKLVKSAEVTGFEKHYYNQLVTGNKQTMRIGLVELPDFNGAKQVVHTTLDTFFDVLLYEVIFDITATGNTVNSLTVHNVNDYRAYANQQNYFIDSATESESHSVNSMALLRYYIQNSTKKKVFITLTADISWEIENTWSGNFFIDVPNTCCQLDINLNGFTLRRDGGDTTSNSTYAYGIRVNGDASGVPYGCKLNVHDGIIALSKRNGTLVLPNYQQQAMFKNFSYAFFNDVTVDKQVAISGQDIGVCLINTLETVVKLNNVDFTTEVGSTSYGGNKVVTGGQRYIQQSGVTLGTNWTIT